MRKFAAILFSIISFPFNSNLFAQIFEKVDTTFNYKLDKVWQHAKNNSAIKIPLIYINEKGNIVQFDGYAPNGCPEFKSESNNTNLAASIATDKVWPGGGSGFALTGNSMSKLGMWDGGAPRISHREFVGRISLMDTASAGISGHSTAVAGILMASGITSTAKGMAYETNLKGWDFYNDRQEMAIGAPNLLVSNHSYVNQAAWVYSGGFQYWLGDTALSMTKDWKFGYYDMRTKQFDSIAFLNPNYLIVKAAGNDRGNGVAPSTLHYYWSGSAWVASTTTRDSVGPYDAIVTYGNSKNILTVGAVNTIPGGYSGPSSVVMTSFSGWGPTDDGRIKPDIVSPALTNSTTSSSNDSAYGGFGSSTSCCTPVITGSLLLLQQHYFNLKNSYMKSATLKALAINTTDAPKITLGPNYESGWGLMNTNRAAQLISDSLNNIIAENNLLNNDSVLIFVYSKGLTPIKATICWTDKEHSIAPYQNDPTTLMLINDLDMRITKVSNSQLYQPYVLNPASPATAATTGDNFRDNVEQIYISTPVSGLYQIKIKHKVTLNTSANPQKFSLVLSGAYASPTISSSFIQFTNVNSSSMRISFTKGNGSRRIVVAKSGSSVSAFPVNGNLYNYDSAFGNGANLGSNNYVVYNGTSNTCIVKNLNINTVYYFAVFEYNGDSVGTLYQTNSFLTGSQITLPVKWLSVTAELVDNAVLIKWSSTHEINNNYFAIEKSMEQLPNTANWNKIGQIKGNETKNSISNYQFVDNDVSNQLESTIFYRIKQVDLDGKYAYSKIVNVNLKNDLTDEIIQVFPNPFKNEIYISRKSQSSKNIIIKVFDILGKNIYTQTIDFIHANQSIKIDLSKIIDSGIYLLSINDKTYKLLIKE